MNASALHEYLRTSRQVHVIDHDGVLWMTDQYVLVRLRSDGGPLGDLFRFWNLPLAPGSYDVGERVARAAADRNPKIGGLLTVPATAIPAEPETIGGEPVYVKLGALGFGAVFSTPKGPAVVDVAKWRAVEALAEVGEWLIGEPVKPMLRIDADRNVVAAVMPVRYSFHELVAA